MFKIKELIEVISDKINPLEYQGTVVYIGLENIESNSGRLVGDITHDYKSIKSIKNLSVNNSRISL